MPIIWLKSRRYTPSDASSQTVAAVNGRKQSTTTGNRIAVQGTCPMKNGETASSTMVDTDRWNSAEPIVLQVRVSSGKTTRFTKAAFSTTSVVARFAHSEKNEWMFNPANSTIAY